MIFTPVFWIHKKSSRPEGYSGETPVVFLTFNRPDLTQKVFERIRQARPRRLYFVSDGPRIDRPNDARLVMETRAIADQVDWPCEVIRDFAPANLGCRDRVCSGIDHAFDREESAIILEDDCLPDLSFFGFCEQLLKRYWDEPKVMHIGGNNFLWGRIKLRESYYFSKYPHIWGWATWRRAWKHRDMFCEAWRDTARKSLVQRFATEVDEFEWMARVYDDLTSLRPSLNTWDYPWQLTCWDKEGFAITPAVNLVTNMGFSDQATHTVQKMSWLLVPANSMQGALRHPLTLQQQGQLDRRTFEACHMCLEPRRWKRISNQIKITAGRYRRLFQFFAKRAVNH